jgi:hypothetical protein
LVDLHRFVVEKYRTCLHCHIQVDASEEEDYFLATRGVVHHHHLPTAGAAIDDLPEDVPSPLGNQTAVHRAVQWQNFLEFSSQVARRNLGTCRHDEHSQAVVLAYQEEEVGEEDLGMVHYSHRDLVSLAAHPFVNTLLLEEASVHVPMSAVVEAVEEDSHIAHVATPYNRTVAPSEEGELNLLLVLDLQAQAHKEVAADILLPVEDIHIHHDNYLAEVDHPLVRRHRLP